ncbi:MAG: PAS domain-containing protein, partial [Pseudomonadota bacterium]
MPENEQNNNHAELRSIYQLAPVGIAAIDSDLRFIRVNRRLAEINGLTPGEHIGKTIHEVGAVLSTQIEPVLHEVLAGRHDETELTVSHEPDGTSGTQVWRFRLAPLRDADETIQGAIVIVDEITAVDEILRTVERQRGEYTRLADTIPMILVRVAGDGTIHFANGRWYDFVGVSRAVHRLNEVAHPVDTPTVISLLDTGNSDSRSFCEARLLDSGGSYRWHLIEAEPVPGEDGGERHWYVTCTDIEKQKRTENKLRRRTEVLIAEDRRKDEFLAVLGHEIRNPVAAMDSAVGALSSDDPATHRWAVGVLRSQLSQITRLVDDLLD